MWSIQFIDDVSVYHIYMDLLLYKYIGQKFLIDFQKNNRYVYQINLSNFEQISFFVELNSIFKNILF